MGVELKSIITCPHCKFSKEESMPTDACQFFYKCSNCGVILKPLEGDCCVFCSYGSVPCPPIQESGSCCNSRKEKLLKSRFN
ncbi:GDCCVxC domain-containing (seleno)protein [Salinimicrobium soli]|uniref:GDCCVxC domain-containing (seleno)protein n=1 Tax=Salinimicrobium soli TaxID=1254399 RepID=UPI003AAA4657